MRLTRGRIRDAIRLAKRDLNERAIERATRSILRKKQSHISVDLGVSHRLLRPSQIFFFELVGGHWAETDGETIALNRCKEYEEDTLHMTLLHESLHGVVVEPELSEYSEHRMMAVLNPHLI